MRRPMTIIRKREAGLTLVELIITAAILSVVLGVIATSGKISSDATSYAKDTARITMLCQNRLGLMRDDLSASVRIFQRNAEGASIWFNMDKTGVEPFVNSLPQVIDANATLGQEISSGTKTGNILFFAKAVRCFPTDEEVTAWQDYCDSNSRPLDRNALDGVRIDVYRLVAYYLRADRSNGTIEVGTRRGLDLVRWVSEPFADRDRVNAVDASVRPLVVEAMSLDQTRGVNYLWELGIIANTAFSEIQPDFSSLTIDLNTFKWKIPRDSRYTEESIFLKRNISVATVWTPSNYEVGKYNEGYTTGYGFPHGFEAQIVGPTSARKVMLHLVLLNLIERNQDAWVSLQQVVTCRDL